MRLDLDLPVGEELGDHRGEQMIVGFEDFHRRRSLQPRRQIGKPHAPGRRKTPRGEQNVRSGGLRGVDQVEQPVLVEIDIGIVDRDGMRRAARLPPNPRSRTNRRMRRSPLPPRSRPDAIFPSLRVRQAPRLPPASPARRRSGRRPAGWHRKRQARRANAPADGRDRAEFALVCRASPMAVQSALPERFRLRRLPSA